MSDKEAFSPQGWLDWQLKSLDGYKDLDKLNRLLISAESTIDQNSGRVKEHALLVAAGLLKSEQLDKYQDELEWALELKTLIEKEIADFPPLPVLPPPGPLEKISGVVEEVTFTKAMACFDAEAYSTMKDELERKRNRDNAGAAITMIAQALSDTAPHALINDGKANKLKCLYVKGRISGKLFSGWFGMTNIRPGDFVEMAVVPSEDGYLAYAVTNPEQRTISLTPGCNTNVATETKLRMLYPLFLLIPFLPFIIFGNLLFVSLAYATAFVILMMYSVVNFRRTKKMKCELYESISNVLSDSNASRNNILIESRRITLEKDSNGEIVRRKEGDPPMPQVDKHEFVWEFFYYY